MKINRTQIYETMYKLAQQKFNKFDAAAIAMELALNPKPKVISKTFAKLRS